MTAADYGPVFELLATTPGISLRAADSREAVERYLARNPGLSFVARSEGRIAACIMSGHDGRRGYLQHLAVEPALRRRGIGAALVEHCLEGLRAAGIHKSHIDVLVENSAAQRYWTNLGWNRRDDLVRYSFIQLGIHPGDENA